MKRILLPYCFVALLLSTAWYVQADEEDDEGESKKKDKDSVGTVIGIDLVDLMTFLLRSRAELGSHPSLDGQVSSQ